MDFGSNPTKKTRWWPIAILIFLIAVTFFTLILAQRRQDLGSRALADSAILSFSPTAVTVAPSNTFNASVVLLTGGQAIVGADILVQFDRTKLALQSLTKPDHAVFKTYAPINSDGNFDTARVISTANNTGIVEFGIIAFDSSGNGNPTGTFNGVISPVTTLTFQVLAGASDTTQITYKYDGVSATTDSNVVADPQGDGNPEDILAAPTSTVTVSISGTASPQPSPSVSASPVPSGGQCNSCYNYNGIGNIDVNDILTLAGRWLARNGDANYDILYDITCNLPYQNGTIDGVINILDIQTIAGQWGNPNSNNNCIP